MLLNYQLKIFESKPYASKFKCEINDRFRKKKLVITFI